MAAVIRQLKLVRYNADDYSLGEVFARPDSAKVSAPADIDGALSLYFQWPERHWAIMMPVGGVPGTGNAPWAECEIDYDRDERAPSELRIQFEGDAKRPDLREGEEIAIRFEVFRICHEMRCQVLACSNAPAEDGWHYIVSPPVELVVFKNRRLSRFRLDDADRQQMGECRWFGEGASEGLAAPVLEIGMSAIRVAAPSLQPGAKGEIVIGEARLAVEVARMNRGEAVLKPILTNGVQTGVLFDLYRKLAFPPLRPKSEFSADAILQLYEETNYFGKFATAEDMDRRKAELRDVWQRIAPALHQYNADYVAVDDAGTPVGTSSATEAFVHEGKPVWALHQTCARTSPDLLEHSGMLYTWRAEYLAARPEALGVIVWFDSHSRWLDRIYVKFARQHPTGTRLTPVKFYEMNLSETSDEAPLPTVQIGETQRRLYDKDGVFGGFGPRYLNASAGFDVLVDNQGGHGVDVLRKAARDTVGIAESGARAIRITVPATESLEGSDLTYWETVDRCLEFDKESLVDFISSVEHSVAITSRKLQGGQSLAS
jgi:hypothetical protein